MFLGAIRIRGMKLGIPGVLFAALVFGQCGLTIDAKALAAPFAISQPAVSRHLRVLEHAGLIRRHRSGREHVLSIDARPLHELQHWVSRYEGFWNEKLDRLERHFASPSEEQA